ncbi:hypothetical protein JCM11491_005853 [Sporobolomyces phaffii]
MHVSDLPPELLYRILELAVEGLPPSLRVRSEILRNFSTVGPSWREPAQILLESKVQIACYSTARKWIDRPRRLERNVIVDELELLYDFNPEDDAFYPLTEWVLKSLLSHETLIVRSLHLRSALFINAFDTSLLLLPAFRHLRHLRLEMPIEPPTGGTAVPIALSRLSLSEMMDQPIELFETVLSNSRDTLVSLHLFVIKGGSPLHQRVLDVLPNLPHTLRHLSISSHWISLPETLLRFVTSCRALTTLCLAGIDFSQVLYLATAVSSPILAFEFTVPSSLQWTVEAAVTTIDHLLLLSNFSRVREITITQRIDSKSGTTPARFQDYRGQQLCKCTFERTLRRALP